MGAPPPAPKPRAPAPGSAPPSTADVPELPDVQVGEGLEVGDGGGDAAQAVVVEAQPLQGHQLAGIFRHLCKPVPGQVWREESEPCTKFALHLRECPPPTHPPPANSSTPTEGGLEQRPKQHGAGSSTGTLPQEGTSRCQLLDASHCLQGRPS